jgi:hypothetical protein
MLVSRKKRMSVGEPAPPAPPLSRAPPGHLRERRPPEPGAEPPGGAQVEHELVEPVPSSRFAMSLSHAAELPVGALARQWCRQARGGGARRTKPLAGLDESEV